MEYLTMMSTYIRHATMCLIVLMMVVMLIVVYIGNQLITPALVSIGQPPTDLPCQIVSSFVNQKNQGQQWWRMDWHSSHGAHTNDAVVGSYHFHTLTAPK